MASETEQPVIYLTGGPATGKSSTVAAMRALCPKLRRFDWGSEARAYVSRRLGREVTYDEIRHDSGTLIRPVDVEHIDRQLIEHVQETRSSAPIVIDTHAVTREAYGFRTTPYGDADWKRLNVTQMFMLYASPDVVAARLANDAAGRRSSDAFHVTMHAALQGAVATTYAILLALPLHTICTDEMSPDAVARNICEISGLGPT